VTYFKHTPPSPNDYGIYKDPYFPTDKILTGLKGKTFLEPGFVHAPYIPSFLTPVGKKIRKSGLKVVAKAKQPKDDVLHAILACQIGYNVSLST
jgi:hypothetical protein